MHLRKKVISTNAAGTCGHQYPIQPVLLVMYVSTDLTKSQKAMLCSRTIDESHPFY